MLVISCNHGGTYIVCNMNGMLTHTPVVAFRVIPYFMQKHIKLLDIEQHIDVSATRLREMEDLSIVDPDDLDKLGADLDEEDREVTDLINEDPEF